MDTLYYNGTIRTMEHFAPEEALLVRDGRVAAAGPFDRLLERSVYTEKVDLAGGCLMPAFLDAHGHILGWAAAKLQADLSKAADYPAVAEAMGRFARERAVPPGGWVLGRGADMLLEEPLAALLDRVLPDRPALVVHSSGHGGVFNAAARRLLGLDRGALVENAFLDAQRRVPLPEMEALVRAFREAQDDYLSHGYVLAQEGFMTAETAGLYAGLERAGAVKMAIVSYGQPDMPCQPGPIPTVGVTNRGNKIFLDGSPQQRTALLSRPYVGGGLGEATMTEEEVLAAARRAGAEGRQLLAHCNGDAAIDRFLGALEAADYPPGLRPVIVHAQLMRRDQMDLARRRGAVASFFPAHARHWGDVHLANLGERAMALSPCRSALDRGVAVTLHQDTPVLPPDPLEAAACAALRRTGSGGTLDPGERIGVYEALRALTAGAAWQYHAEGERGTLAPGKRADLVILDRDPAALPPEELEAVRVLETVGGGRTLWRREG